MVTESDCAVPMLLDPGVTVTVGVVTGCLTVIEVVPDALLKFKDLAQSGVYFEVSVPEPAASDPAGIVMVAGVADAGFLRDVFKRSVAAIAEEEVGFALHLIGHLEDDGPVALGP